MRSVRKQETFLKMEDITVLSLTLTTQQLAIMLDLRGLTLRQIYPLASENQICYRFMRSS